jgi:hypothetical protein
MQYSDLSVHTSLFASWFALEYAEGRSSCNILPHRGVCVLVRKCLNSEIRDPQN